MLNRILVLLFGAVALMGIFAAPAYATGSSTTVHVVSTPDDSVGGTPWARDTFDRKTTVTTVEEGWLVSFTDSGTFKTGDNLVGALTGKGEFVVVGGTLKSTPDAPPSIDRSAVSTKDDFTTSWWKRFIDGGQTEGIVNWKWTYKTECEIRTESSGEGVDGAYPSKHCKPQPSSSITPTTQPTKAASSGVAGKPSVSRSSAVTVQGGLPVTGPGVGVLVATGAAVLALGAALVLLARRRTARFNA